MFALDLILITCLAAGSEDITRIEEDWELVLNVPGEVVDAPQFHTLMSPLGQTDGVHAQVTWNYREKPSALPGGVQIQGWKGESFLTKKDFGGNQLSTVAETVSWTQVLHKNGTQLTFGITNGQSTTWGSFGGGEWHLSGVVQLTNLNGYKPEVSLENSWITYGANRVDLLRIKQIRYYDANGNLVNVDTASRVLHQNQ